MLDHETFSISVPKDWRTVYESLWAPDRFPAWASGLSQSSLRQVAGGWEAQGPEGPITIRFTDHNTYGIMDHTVELGDGVEVYIPLRIVPNQEGCTVLLTLFRQPTTSDAKFAEDAAWIERDLRSLRALFTAEPVQQQF